MIVTIIGLGLIGGSIAVDLRKTGFATELIGVDNSEKHCEKALQLGLVDQIKPLQQAVKGVDIVVVAVPVDKIAVILPEVLDLIDPSTSVTDVGSTKHVICQGVDNHPRRGNYVPAHPMSGTENSGPEAAMEGLFKEKICIICDQEQAKPQHLALIEKMYHTIGLDLAYMTSDEQDHSTAHVSHLPHATSFALANAVLDVNDRHIIFDLASGGFQSTVRLAKSSPEMWGPIFMQNKNYVVESLELYIKHLEEFKQSLESENDEKLMELMRNANRIREVLDGESQELVRLQSTTTKLYRK